MGPPRGVSDQDCGTAAMLVSPEGDAIPGYPAKRHYAYFRPTPAELERLKNGGFLEMVQYGHMVQPFGLVAWEGGE